MNYIKVNEHIQNYPLVTKRSAQYVNCLFCYNTHYLFPCTSAQTTGHNKNYHHPSTRNDQYSFSQTAAVS